MSDTCGGVRLFTLDLGEYKNTIHTLYKLTSGPS